MTNVIEDMTRDELVAKCKNQRFELNNLLKVVESYLDRLYERGNMIRCAIRLIKQGCPLCALSILSHQKRNTNGVELLREIAECKEEENEHKGEV